MPELAKVEQIRNKVEAFALNRKIIGVTSRKDDKVFCYKRPDEIEKALLNKTINKVCRKGKHLWFELNNTPHISFHFGMTGKIKYKPNTSNSETEFKPPYWKVVLKLDNNSFIGYTTKQRLGKIRIYNQLPQLCDPIKDLGWDPQHNMCTSNEFINYLQKKKKKSKLKPALMDQRFICGIGSWIADEICYQSGITPSIYVKELTQKQLQRLYNATVSICNYSVSVNGEGKQYPSNWLFHYRWPKKDYSKGKGRKKFRKFENCEYDGEGNKITFVKVNSRRTAIVYDVQSNDGCRIFRNAIGKGRLDDTNKIKQQKINELFERKIDDGNTNNSNSNNGSGKYKKGKEDFKKKMKDMKNKDKLKNIKDKEIKLNELPAIATKENTAITPLRKSKRLCAMKSRNYIENDESSSDSH